jgi:hypothetical protein
VTARETTADSSPLEPRRDPKKWAFWRVRLARALVLGGVALAAARLLPALPQEQQLMFLAPEGSTIVALDLVWRAQGERAALGGTQLRPGEPTSRLSHRLKVPNGQYELEITARLKSTCTNPPCASDPLQADTERATTEPADGQRTDTHTLLLERTVDLQGDTAQLRLTER